MSDGRTVGRSDGMSRREAVHLLAVAPVAAAFGWAPESVREASALARQALENRAPYEPKNFTAREWETVRLLVDLVIPKDERSGSATDAERAGLLDDIAWPKKAKREHAAGVAFFNSVRDFTASGFFSSKLGVQDLRYIGNAFVAEWKGCPPEALAKLGVSYGA